MKDIKNELAYAEQLWVNNPNNPNYWLDFNEATPNGDGTFTIKCRCVKMPYERVIEMLCDFIGAGKAYNKTEWTVHTPLEYWKKNCEGKRAMHKDSEKLLVTLLEKLDASDGLDDFIAWYNVNKEKLEKTY